MKLPPNSKKKGPKAPKGLRSAMENQPPKVDPGPQPEPEVVEVGSEPAPEPKPEARVPDEVLPPEGKEAPRVEAQPSMEESANLFGDAPPFGAPANDVKPAGVTQEHAEQAPQDDGVRSVDASEVHGTDEEPTPRKRRKRGEEEAPHDITEYRRAAETTVEFGDAVFGVATEFMLAEHAEKGRIAREKYQKLSDRKITDKQKESIVIPLAAKWEAEKKPLDPNNELLFAIGMVYLQPIREVLTLRKEGVEKKDKEDAAEAERQKQIKALTPKKPEN